MQDFSSTMMFHLAAPLLVFGEVSRLGLAGSSGGVSLHHRTDRARAGHAQC